MEVLLASFLFIEELKLAGKFTHLIILVLHAKELMESLELVKSLEASDHNFLGQRNFHNVFLNEQGNTLCLKMVRIVPMTLQFSCAAFSTKRSRLILHISLISEVSIIFIMNMSLLISFLIIAYLTFPSHLHFLASISSKNSITCPRYRNKKMKRKASKKILSFMINYDVATDING